MYAYIITFRCGINHLRRTHFERLPGGATDSNYVIVVGSDFRLLWRLLPGFLALSLLQHTV